MFDPTDSARVFALPPGVDFPAELIAGLTARCPGPPGDLARVRLVVNTRRMARRIRELFDQGPARLLPRVTLVTEAELLGPRAAILPPAMSPLRRRLELARLVGELIDRQPDLAARDSVFDLADSLAALLDEMQGEGVAPQVIRDLDVSDMSGHWARAQAFIGIAEGFAAATGGALDPQARQRRAVTALIESWQVAPPADPVIVAGSTGSRGTTALLMDAVARLPQGAVVLPGFDFDMDDTAWDDLDDAMTAEDHPQFRFRRLLDRLDLRAGDVGRWTDAHPPSAARNRLISLALRPAPVTDAWMREGPKLTGLSAATAPITLIEAPSPRAEALAIALRLRRAAETGQTAALITPDRMLTRQVAAALDRWRIEPDDSAGMPLHLSPPGRFLRHVAELFAERLTGAALLTLLKHPLCHSGDGRGDHLRHSRDLELHLRRHGPPFPDESSLRAWAAGAKVPGDWADWLCRCFCGQDAPGAAPLAERVERLVTLAEALAAGSHATGSGGLWERNPGQQAAAVMAMLRAEAGAGGAMAARDFADLLRSLLSAGEVRDRDAPHPGIMIWGTLEARVQGADLLILGGLNDGSWPEAPPPDPWLNRRMRHDAGLLLPERRIGLAAHDFQQAVAAREVWLTRAIRSDDAETVPSRWLNRLVNLLGGLPDQGGQAALAAMRERGRAWLDMGAQLERADPVPPAPRPSPRPPLAARPRQLSVTEIQRLIRDPYAIYARHTLALKPLDPLVQEPDARLRGTIMHDVLERLVRDSLAGGVPDRAGFLALAETVLTRDVPWPAARRLWLARLGRIADWFLATEAERQANAAPVGFEIRGKAGLTDPAFTLTGKADRIDRDDAGNLLIYDYKTGAPPSAAEQGKFDKQLLLEAVMAEMGGFEGLDPAPVAAAMFIGVGASPKQVAAPLEDEPPEKVWDEFRQLIAAYMRPEQGFTARRMLQRDSIGGDYDHLARFGEWDHSTDPTPEDLS
jgi:double-strand break repair protein AddB